MLKYIGTGFLPGVPARDLSDDEVEQHGGPEWLIASGLYTRERAMEIKVEARAAKPTRVEIEEPSGER